MPTLRSMGENAVVEALLRRLPPLSGLVRVGPGDDCAVVAAPETGRDQLLKTDCVVEGVHFERGEDLQRVGWKALCRALSDVAAMGGTPRCALLTVLFEKEMELRRAEALFVGIARAAEAFGVDVVGGETGHTSGPLVCNVALTGWVE
ncbi:MAG: hypothetical protein RLZZ142_196, partial [Verrucomicrobiota bacterium]